MNKFHVAVFGGQQDDIHPEIRKIASSIDYHPYDEDKILDTLNVSPDVILCFQPAEGGMAPLEIAQALRATYPKTPLFFISTDTKTFDKKRLVKNGFQEVYLLPWEKVDLISSMKEQRIYSQVPELQDYKAVKIVDIHPGIILNFSMKIYLPMNGKLVQFSLAGEPLDEEKLKKLSEQNFNTLYISKDDLTLFKEYTKNVFKEKLSETDRKEKLEGCVRDLLSDMFIDDSKENTFTRSQSLMSEVKEVISMLIHENNPDLFKRISSLMNQEDTFYNHLVNVAAYAGFFAMALGFEKPEQIALAGLLHDLGKVNLPKEVADNPSNMLSPHAFEAYKQHPKYTIDILKLKRVLLPEATANAILHHHESMSGDGYPQGLEARKISLEGRILAIANTFDHLTSLVPGRYKLNPHEALIRMVEEGLINPGKAALDIELLQKLKGFFIKKDL
jgi:HD-GYP domain-containing protein (c-di-GMP phosphodiesterase class II)